MKTKKIIFYIFILLSPFLIYKLSYKPNINYVVLGDSLAAGQYPFQNFNYGYADYIKDYLYDKGVLGTYIKEYAKSGYKIEDVKYDLFINRNIGNNNIRSLLRESDLVTISIGANDLKEGLNANNFSKFISEFDIKKIDHICNKLDLLIKEIKKYAKKDIILIGYYNPFPHFDDYKNDIDKIIKYFNNRYREISKKNNIYFVDIFNEYNEKKEYLPNPLDIHPNNYGYKQIFNCIKPIIDKKILANK